MGKEAALPTTSLWAAGAHVQPSSCNSENSASFCHGFQVLNQNFTGVSTKSQPVTESQLSHNSHYVLFWWKF